MAQNRQRIQRLARREEKVIIKRIIYLSVISLLLAIFIFTVGISLLGKFSDLLGTVFKGKEEKAGEQTSLQPPLLDDLPQATNSAKLKVFGFSSDGVEVEIFLDDEKIADAQIRNSKFEYEDLVLKNGENRISAKAKKGDSLSDPSNVAIVILDKQDPSIQIDSPEEGQTFSGNNRIKVSGKTDNDAQVYANGFLASVDLEGKFEVLVPVSEGESTIEIKAIDQAGNTKVEKRKVNFRK